MGYWPFKIDETQPWAYSEAFTAKECDKIIKLGNKSKLTKSQTGDLVQSDTIRNSSTRFLSPDENSTWIFQRLTDVTEYLNKEFFNFDLQGFGENLQFTKYEAPTGHYSFHTDSEKDLKIRKLSLVVQLTDENDYAGGDLEIKLSDDETKLHRTRGTLLCFPSYVLHRVTPVTEGTRYSLVAWVTGPQFK
jgi:PKHD-type hydroxylase